MNIEHIYFDGDILINKVAFALERREYTATVDGETVLTGAYKKPLEKELKEKGHKEYELKLNRWVEREDLLGPILNDMIKSVCDRLECKDYLVVIGPKDSSKNFRHKIAVTAPYKGTRDKANRPILYSKVRNYLIEKHNSQVTRSDIESDDLLGIYLTNNPNNAIIASIDKDLLQIPGNHYNLDSREVIQSTDPGKIWVETRKDGKRKDLKGYGYKWFCAQMLLGDAVDNIKKPLNGFGPIKAFEYLNGTDGIYKLFYKVRAFYKKHSTLERFRENYKLLWILRK
jgi:5'-3' exonuclease